jgi:hypothetical protein
MTALHDVLASEAPLAPMQLLLAAQEMNEELSDGGMLRRHARHVAQLCRLRSCNALLAASPAGERLLAAVLMLAPREFHGHRLGDGADRVAVLEGACVTPLAMVHLANLLRRTGTSNVHGIALSITDAAHAHGLSSLDVCH